nr:Transmembrane protein [Ipomoea batatas]
MASFSGLGIGLSFVFGCILMGLVAELYYLLWVRRRIRDRETEGEYTSIGSDIAYLFCCKKSNSVVTRTSTQALTTSELNGYSQDLEVGTGKDSLLKGFGEDDGVESELMRLHNLCGPPRFLFTIKEETKEDLESEDGKSRKGSRTRSLSHDLMIGSVETPLLSPLSSPPLKPLALESYSHHGFNPLFESSTEAALNRMRSSPPPKLKFLRDAEEKLIKRLVQEAEKRALRNGGSVQNSAPKPSPNSNGVTEVKDGSFMSFLDSSKAKEVKV